jgi:ABC-type nickel/cobalt efflux system permease component RcnA
MTGEWLMILSGVLLLVLGLYFLWRNISLNRRKAASASWPVINARVTAKDVSLRRGQRGSSYIPEVDYTYTVMNAVFQKHKSLGAKATRDGAEKVLAEMGDAIEMRYNPEKPDEHVTVLDKVGFADILLVVVLFILAAVMFYLAAV